MHRVLLRRFELRSGYYGLDGSGQFDTRQHGFELTLQNMVEFTMVERRYLLLLLMREPRHVGA
jgi:hypothetical protein